MPSVTQRIDEVSQPHGGYLPKKFFSVQQYDDGIVLKEENITPGLVGLAVDYMTRFMLGSSAEQAFGISKFGAMILDSENHNSKETKRAEGYINSIDGLNKASIICACRLAGYDVCLRAGTLRYRPVEEITPDDDTVDNIIVMVKRSLAFFKEYGPIVKSGFTFEGGGYTATVSTGDGDFATKDTLWDFKVSKREPDSKQTLQLLMYYIMGKHSKHDYLKRLNKIGIFNPRLNRVYLFNISDLSPEVIEEVSKDVIGYSDGKQGKNNSASGISSSARESIGQNVQQEESGYYTMKDLAARYGVSTSKISQSIPEWGIPYYKEGRSYRFDKKAVYNWEVSERTISYGRNGYIELPAYTELKLLLRAALKKAKKEKNKEMVKEIRMMMKKHGVSRLTDAGKTAILITIALLAVPLTLLILYFFF